MTVKKLSILTSIILTSAILGFSMQDNAVYATTSSIGDTVFEDINNNGVQDSEDSGIVGVTVNLLDEFNTVIDATITDTDGIYMFEGLTPGIYSVHVVGDTIPAGLDPGMCPTVFNIEFIGGDSFLDADFCYTITTSSIGDTVFEDINNNGVQDSEDSGIVGVTVNLVCDVGSDSTVTGVNGNYLFTGIQPDSVCDITTDPTTAPCRS